MIAKIRHKIETNTIKQENVIFERLKNYSFIVDSIKYHCNKESTNRIDYSYNDFMTKFKIISFKPDAKIADIKHNQLNNHGIQIVTNELGSDTFINNMSTFEYWLLSCLDDFYKNYLPKFIDDSVNKQITIKEITKFNSIDELISSKIDSHLMTLPYKGMKGELLFLIKKFSLKESDFVKGSINEIEHLSLLRNVIVHNNKEINQTYLDKAKNLAKYKLGDKVIVDSDILFTAAEQLIQFMQCFKNKIKSIP